jgi:hypothetical protein
LATHISSVSSEVIEACLLSHLFVHCLGALGAALGTLALDRVLSDAVLVGTGEVLLVSLGRSRIAQAALIRALRPIA